MCMTTIIDVAMSRMSQVQYVYPDAAIIPARNPHFLFAVAVHLHSHLGIHVFAGRAAAFILATCSTGRWSWCGCRGRCRAYRGCRDVVTVVAIHMTINLQQAVVVSTIRPLTEYIG